MKDTLTWYTENICYNCVLTDLQWRKPIYFVTLSLGVSDGASRSIEIGGGGEGVVAVTITDD